MNKEEKDFLELIKANQEKVESTESYASFIDFLDEDGCVIFQCEKTQDGIIFRFADSSEDFLYKGDDTDALFGSLVA